MSTRHGSFPSALLIVRKIAPYTPTCIEKNIGEYYTAPAIRNKENRIRFEFVHECETQSTDLFDVG